MLSPAPRLGPKAEAKQALALNYYGTKAVGVLASDEAAYCAEATDAMGICTGRRHARHSCELRSHGAVLWRSMSPLSGDRCVVAANGARWLNRHSRVGSRRTRYSMDERRGIQENVRLSFNGECKFHSAPS